MTLSSGVRIEDWTAFKKFVEDNSLTIYPIEYDTKVELGVYLQGVRHYYVMLFRWTDELTELNTMLGTSYGV